MIDLIVARLVSCPSRFLQFLALVCEDSGEPIVAFAIANQLMVDSEPSVEQVEKWSGGPIAV